MNQSTNPQLEPIVRAIDAGFGVMKFTRRATQEEAGQAKNGVVFDSFLSLTLDATGDQAAVANARTRDTVLVDYNGSSYEVGKGVEHALVASDFGRDMTDAYYDSDVYHALMRGALTYMKEDEIDTLVLGLPMNHYQKKARVASLQAHYTGKIELGQGRSVMIDKVLVHPQPFGGYVSLGHDLDGINAALKQYPECGITPLKAASDLSKLNILIVDPGEFTLDWLLMTPGGHAERVSSAAGDAGRHRILREIHALVEKKLERPLGASFVTDLDRALRNKEPIRIGGRLFDLSGPEFTSAITKAVEDPVRQLLESLRGADDRIDFIAVLGGSPEEVANALRKARPFLPLYCPSSGRGQASSMFANLKGFQEWGEAAADQAIAA
jgi:plasmid segregation protein ParM